MFRPLPLALLAALAFVATTTVASEVFMTKDAQGHPIYTDRPDSLPAEKVSVATKQTDTVEVQKRYAAEMKQYADADKTASEGAKQAADTRQAQQMSATDKAKRCEDARTRYTKLMTSHRLYQQDDKGERRYLDSKEIDDARANAKSVMDEFCSGQ